MEIFCFWKLYVNFIIEGYDVIRIGIFVILIELLKILKEMFLYGMIGGGEILCGLWWKFKYVVFGLWYVILVKYLG